MIADRTKVVYRRATADEIDLLVDSRIQFLNSFFDHPYDEETETLKNNLIGYFSEKVRTNEYIAWVAEKEGALIGMSGMVIWELPPKYNIENGKAGYILNMYTAPEERNKGICTNLLRRLINDAKKRGIYYLHLHASEMGLSIYKKAGFKEAEQIELSLRLQKESDSA
jgi:ribosomal protein S18 acetylase RimI-like enzyme